MLKNSKNIQSKYLSTWDTEDIVKWLSDINMSSYSNVFESNKINGYDLCYLTNENLLNDLRISRFHDRNVILQAIKVQLYEQLVLTVSYGETTYNVQLDFDLNLTLEKITIMLKEIFQIHDSRFFLHYAEKTNILAPSCKLIEMILLNPNAYKHIYLTKDLRTSLPCSNNLEKVYNYDRDNINSKLTKPIDEKYDWEKKNPTRNFEDYDFEKRTPIKNFEQNEKEKKNPSKSMGIYELDDIIPTKNYYDLDKSNHINTYKVYEIDKNNPIKNYEEKVTNLKEEKEITTLKKDDLHLNNSVDINLKSIYYKEKPSYNQIDDVNYNNDLLDESIMNKKNEMLDRTNVYFNNLATKISLKSEYNKSTYINEKKKNDQRQGPRFASETRYNRESEKDNSLFVEAINKPLNHNLNENNEKSDYGTKLSKPRNKEDEGSKVNKVINNNIEKEKEIDKGINQTTIRNNKYSTFKLPDNNNYNHNYSKKI